MSLLDNEDTLIEKTNPYSIPGFDEVNIKQLNYFEYH